MEIKLELADIAGYLPYGLQLTVDKSNSDEFGKYSVRDLERIANNTNIISFADKKYIVKGGTEFYQYSYLYFKPVLRPMTDLTKPMTHPDINDGEEFVPIDYIDIYTGFICDRNSINAYDSEWVFQSTFHLRLNLVNAVKLFNLLNKLHFDYNDLIGQGLAIDINTIE